MDKVLKRFAYWTGEASKKFEHASSQCGSGSCGSSACSTSCSGSGCDNS